MTEKKGNNPNFFKIGEIGATIKPLAVGADSKVVKVTHYRTNINVVAKTYGRSEFRSIGGGEEITILKQYAMDTERARELCLKNPNPLNQTITFNNKDFLLEYEIIPQGGILLEEEKEGSDKTLKISFGQKFIKGQNLSQLNGSVSLKDENVTQEPTKKQEIFSRNTILNVSIETACKKLFAELSLKLDVPFMFNEVNIKPFVSKNKIKIVITDLCAELREYAKYNKAFVTIK